jgi:hypothetical protein
MTLVPLLAILIALGGCSGYSALSPSTSDNTDSAGVTLVPYGSREFGISGVGCAAAMIAAALTGK